MQDRVSYCNIPFVIGQLIKDLWTFAYVQRHEKLINVAAIQQDDNLSTVYVRNDQAALIKYDRASKAHWKYYYGAI